MRDVGGTVRLLYLSNAERYFNYNDAFRKSMLALPTDERSLILRTRARRDGTYEYILQEAANFTAWVSRRSIELSFQYTHLREPVKDATTNQVLSSDLFAITRLPTPPAESRPKRPPALQPDARSGTTAGPTPSLPGQTTLAPTPQTGRGI